jgi:DNA-directed RNA polymerase subunit E"
MKNLQEKKEKQRNLRKSQKKNPKEEKRKMHKPRACKMCNIIVEEGDKCPRCGSKELTEGAKGRVVILNPEKSEVAKKLALKEKGNYAIKTR